MVKILQSRVLPASVSGSVKYKQILCSIEDVGLIEPLSVAISDPHAGQYLLLDGHVR
jgi:ParB-like chromosome segregation protein Spo0J